ncbi:MAG TPA: FecR family protein [Niastella sp.]|nr:FecR family protein [Niastella sp.]
MANSLKNELLVLLEKARAGNATGNDYSRIAAIINTDQTGELIAEADAFFAQEVPLSTMHIDPYDYDHWQRAFLEIKEAYQQQNIQPVKVRRLPAASRWLIAASILFVLSVGVYLFINSRSAQQTAASAKILPGKDGAILTLADGSQILLDTIKNGVVALQGGATAKIVNGTLVYEGNGGEAVYNIMSTPKGRKFHLVMPDGTEAWLNSASSIQFPTAFTGNERKVTVTGEVYFEVATRRLGSGQKMPFKVNVNDNAEIEVLGTHFNVKAYENEPVINTTLLEGSIAIRLKDDKNGKVGKQSILKPGQQAKILVGQNNLQVNAALPKNDAAKNGTGLTEKEGLTVVNNTDVDKVMAWKNNVFDFNDIAFEDAMYQLERWYNIEVVYEKGIAPTNVELSGKMTKDVTLNDLVSILEKVGLKCKLEGRKLLIQP